MQTVSRWVLGSTITVCLVCAIQAGPAWAEGQSDPWASEKRDLKIGLSVVGMGIGAAGLVVTGLVFGSEGIRSGYNVSAFLLSLVGSLSALGGGATGLGTLREDAHIPGWLPWTLFFGGVAMACAGELMIALKHRPTQGKASSSASPTARESSRPPGFRWRLAPTFLAQARAAPPPGLVLLGVWQ